MKNITIFQIIFVVIFCGAWGINLYDFANCDFKSGFKCEAVKGFGVIIPPAAIVTVFVEDDLRKSFD